VRGPLPPMMKVICSHLWSFIVIGVIGMKLEELQVYQMTMDIAERIWRIVIRWNHFARDTIGKQLMRAVDSVGANLSEGFGRFHYGENKQFCYYARGSLYETRTWLIKAYNRGLIDEEVFQSLHSEIEKIGVKLNNYIRSIGRKQQMTTNDDQ